MHTDVCGPIAHTALDEHKYFLILPMISIPKSRCILLRTNMKSLKGSKLILKKKVVIISMLSGQINVKSSFETFEAY